MSDYPAPATSHPASPGRPELDAEAVRQLPAVVNLVTAARALGVGRTVAYELVRTGAWPTPVLRLGHQIKIPTAPLLALLGLSPSREDETVPVGHDGHPRGAGPPTAQYGERSRS